MTLATVDFLRLPRRPVVGWLLLALGVGSLTVSLWIDGRMSFERRETVRIAQEQLAAKESSTKPAPPRQSTMAERRAQQAVQELELPWLPALRAVESATVDPVYLLSMNVDPDTGLIRLEAEAPSFDHALAYVQGLDEDGALQATMLVSHAEPAVQRPDMAMVRFSVNTYWNRQ